MLDLNNVTSNAVQATASYVDLRYCEIRSAYIGLGLESATGNLYYCKGQCTFSVFCMSGIAFCTGTVPSGGRTSSCNGQIFDAGVTTDAGATVAPQTPDDTTLQYATLTKSYRGGWRTDTLDVVQGGVFGRWVFRRPELELRLHVVWQSARRAVRQDGQVRDADPVSQDRQRLL